MSPFDHMQRETTQRLSPREEAILDLASQGFTDNAIAHSLGISDGTVGTYWGRVRAKIGPYPRTELIAIRIRDELQKKIDAALEQRDLLSKQLVDQSEGLLCHSIFEAAEEGILVIGAGEVIEHANPAAHQIFGYDEGGLAGRPLTDVVPDRFQKEHLARVAEFRQNPRNRAMHPHLSASGLRRDGQEIQISMVISAVTRGDELLVTSFFHLVEE